jgi:hypothetical protein
VRRLNRRHDDARDLIGTVEIRVAVFVAFHQAVKLAFANCGRRRRVCRATNRLRPSVMALASRGLVSRVLKMHGSLSRGQASVLAVTMAGGGRLQTPTPSGLCLLLALGAGNGPPRGAGDLGDDAFLLVFGQVFHQRS